MAAVKHIASSSAIVCVCVCVQGSIVRCVFSWPWFGEHSLIVAGWLTGDGDRQRGLFLVCNSRPLQELIDAC